MDKRLVNNIMHIKQLKKQKQQFNTLIEKNKKQGKDYAEMLRG